MSTSKDDKKLLNSFYSFELIHYTTYILITIIVIIKFWIKSNIISKFRVLNLRYFKCLIFVSKLS